MLKKTDVLMGGHLMLDEEMSFVFVGKEKDGDHSVQVLNGKGVTLESLVCDAIITLMNHSGKNTIAKVAIMAALMAKVRQDVLTGDDVKMTLEFCGCKFDPDEFMAQMEEDEKKAADD